MTRGGEGRGKGRPQGLGGGEQGKTGGGLTDAIQIPLIALLLASELALGMTLTNLNMNPVVYPLSINRIRPACYSAACAPFPRLLASLLRFLRRVSKRSSPVLPPLPALPCPAPCCVPSGLPEPERDASVHDPGRDGACLHVLCLLEAHCGHIRGGACSHDHLQGEA